VSDWLRLREAYHAKMRRAAEDWERAATDLASLHIAIWETMVEKGKTEDLASEKSHSIAGEPT
jgi:hypothetical protein